MVLIISRESHYSTNQVMQWLGKYGIPCLRVNKGSEWAITKLTIDHSLPQGVDLSLQIAHQEVHLDDISQILVFKDGLGFPDLSEAISLHPEKQHYYLTEWNTLKGFVYGLLQAKTVHGNIMTEPVNKLQVLLEATKHGLKVPTSLVCTQKDQLTKFSQKHSTALISKPIQDALYFFDQHHKYYSYTSKVSHIVDQMPENFYPSLFQEEVKKAYELRIFFDGDGYYPMAIFTKQIEGCVVSDSRSNHSDAPNRMVPYRLPASVERKLKALMKTLGLTTGSIDMMVTKAREFVFLEVNPSGQFGFLSYHCNYQIEQKIALKISENYGKLSTHINHRTATV